METHGVIGAAIELGNNSILHDFQLVNKQVYIQCDGILGRDFLQSAQAKICYVKRTVNLKGEKCKMVGKARPIELEEPRGVKIERIALAPRTESIVRFPVTLGSPRVGIIQKRELQGGVFLAASLTKVVNGFAITSILNTAEEELDVDTRGGIR
jgi:hypothetical protein